MPMSSSGDSMADTGTSSGTTTGRSSRSRRKTRRRGLGKNFHYGDMWPGRPRTSDEHGFRVVDPSTITSSKTFLNWIKNNHYKIILDHDFDGIAQTRWNERKIILNANYDPRMLEALLQHELGHLMIFNVDQWTTVGDVTLRSIISKVIYSIENVRRWPMSVLLRVENVVQDIIIETMSSSCICSVDFSLYGERAGVKHLDRMEDACLIAEEVCDQLLTDEGSQQLSGPVDSGALKRLLESMKSGLEGDEDDIRKETDRVTVDHPSVWAQRRSLEKKWSKMADQLERLNRKIEHSGSTPHLEDLKRKLEKNLDRLDSDEEHAAADERGRKADERRLKSLRDALKTDDELLSEIQRSLDDLNNNTDGNDDDTDNTGGNTDDDTDDDTDGNTNGNAGSDDGAGLSDDQLHKNLTDHFNGEGGPGGGYSCDIGFPPPVTVKRGDPESRYGRGALKITQNALPPKIVITDDDGDDILATGHRTAQKITTWFRPNRREITPHDMIAGTKRVRATGASVLIGLDVSGSMMQEWTEDAEQIGRMVEDLRTKISIERVTFFTYDTTIHEIGESMEDLHPHAQGGNAFGWVYPQIMQRLPVLLGTEIVLVTDCGDNLGFPLERSCVVERGGENVKVHIDVVDVGDHGFYDHTDATSDWSFTSSSDSSLAEKVRKNVEELLES